MSIYPDLPFDQAGGHGGRRAQTQIVVVHATFNTASDENEAHYAEHRSDQVSAHFYNDGDSVIQALDTDVVAYGCFSEGNSRSVQFELVGLDWDSNPPGPTAVSDATMREAARIVARVCAQYGIPVRKIGAADLRAGTKGICGHADVTVAWGQGDHMDPGPAFPWERFISYVQGGATMADSDIPDTHRLASNADTWTRALVKGENPAQFLGSGAVAPNFGTTPNVLHQKLDVIVTAVTAPVPVTMTQADRDAIVAALVQAVIAGLPHIPSLQEIEDAAYRGANRAEDS